MSNALLPKAVLAALAAVGLLLPFGAPLPGSCLRTIGVAGAAPSPSCGGDLRECLRASADLRQTTFSGRYVTADDVARCMEAFNACISGGASRGGNASPSQSATAGDAGAGSLPQRFKISSSDYQADCRVSGRTISCTHSWEPSPDAYGYEYTGETTGKLSGLMMDGTTTTSQRGSSGCIANGDFSGPVTYTFTPDGNVSVREGPLQGTVTFSGDCANSPPSSKTIPVREIQSIWSPNE